jgi:hypothetical protein
MVNTPEKPHLIEAMAGVTDDLPLYRRVTCELPSSFSSPLTYFSPSLLSAVNLGNLEISPIATQKEVLEQKLWPWADNLINKTYFEL